MQWIVGLFFILHGIGHVMGFLASWTPVPVGFSDAPWLLGTDVRMKSPSGRVWGLLWAIAAFGWVAAGILVISGGDWQQRAIYSAVLSMAAILPWWRAIPTGPKLAILVDIAVLAALVPPWGQQVVDWIG